jgi:phosphatidylglycerol:prolipoprotein diacylglycerol transferase
MYKLSRKEFFIVFDLLLIIVPIGIVLGRLGNFLNQELYGIVVPSNLLWLNHPWLTHVYSHVDNLLRFNTNFISAGLEGLLIRIVAIILLYKQRRAGKRKP